MQTTKSFSAVWSDSVERQPNAPFLTFVSADGNLPTRTWTYREFDRLVDRAIAILKASGITAGGRVHSTLSNSPAFVAFWLACTRLGAVFVPADPRSTSREIDAHLSRLAATVGVFEASGAIAYKSAVARHHMHLIEALPFLDGVTGERSELPLPQPDVVATILFTSGTTAAPKGVQITQANYVFAGEVMAAAGGVTRQDRLLVVLPLFHANAQYYSLAPAIVAGAHVVLASRFTASRFAQIAARHRATHASLFAGPIRMILDKTPAGTPPINLRHCWYAQKLEREEYKRFEQLSGCSPRQLYGMTETVAAVLTAPTGLTDPALLGETTSRCRVTFEPTGEDAPAGTAEILVGGTRGREIFAGYLDDDIATMSSFREGWFATGDLVFRDEDGLRFAGRRADTLKVAGENVSALEIEHVLGSHPSVLEVAVISEPDPIRDEVPVAHVVTTGDPTAVANELLAWSKIQLSPAKRPRRVVVHPDPLPKTSVGKLDKHKLRQTTERKDTRSPGAAWLAEPPSEKSM